MTDDAKRDRVAAFREAAGDPLSLGGLSALAALRLGERLVFAWGLLVATDDVARGVVFVLVAGCVHLFRGWVALHVRIRVRIAVEMRAASALLAADPLAPLATGGDDPFSTFYESVEGAIRLVVDLVPAGLGDAVAATLLAVWLAASARLADFAVLVVAALVGAGLVLVARRITRWRGREAWLAQLPTWVQLRMILCARDELVACGHEASAEGELLRRLRRWAAVERSYQTLAGVTGRVPVMAAAGVVLLAFVTRDHVGLDAGLWRQVLTFGAAATPVTALLSIMHDVAQAERKTASLVELMTAAREQREAAKRERTASRHIGPAPHALAARKLSYRYPGAVVDSLAEVSFDWRAGRLLVVTGANGSGKSTLIKLLLRLAEPSSGHLELDGHEGKAFDLLEWRRSFAYVSQTPYIDEDATVADFFHLLAPQVEPDIARRALERVGLWARLATAAAPLSVRMRALSAGQRQRAVLARALVQDRPIVVLDEPDASLDAEGLTSLIAVLRELCDGRLVAVVAHSPAILAAADDRLVLGGTSLLNSRGNPS